MTSPTESIAADVLTRAGIPFRLHEHPPARTEAELHLTGLDIDTSAKTLAFTLPDERFVLAAIPGRARLRYGKLARALGVARAALRPMLADELRQLGMTPGGVTPVCADPRVVRVLDRSLLDHPVLYCGGGTPELTIEIAAADLVRLEPTAVLADLCGDSPFPA